MFAKAKIALMKKLMKSQLASLPAEQREFIEMLMEKNPELLMEIAQCLQEEMKKGKDQMAAMQVVAQKYQYELKKVAGDLKKAA